MKPSTQGQSWELGTICVNIGCVPKFPGNYIKAHVKFVDSRMVDYSLLGRNSGLRETEGKSLVSSDIPGVLEHAIITDDVYFNQ